MIDSKEERDREWINVEKCCDRAWELWSHDFRHLPIMIGNNENFPLKIFLSKRENLVTSSPGPRLWAGHLWSEVKNREISLVVIQHTTAKVLDLIKIFQRELLFFKALHICVVCTHITRHSRVQLFSIYTFFTKLPPSMLLEKEAEVRKVLYAYIRWYVRLQCENLGVVQFQPLTLNWISCTRKIISK